VKHAGPGARGRHHGELKVAGPLGGERHGVCHQAFAQVGTHGGREGRAVGDVAQLQVGQRGNGRVVPRVRCPERSRRQLLVERACVALADQLAVVGDAHGLPEELHADVVRAAQLQQLRRIAAIVPRSVGADAHVDPSRPGVDEHGGQPLRVGVPNVQHAAPLGPCAPQRELEIQLPVGPQRYGVEELGVALEQHGPHRRCGSGTLSEIPKGPVLHARAAGSVPRVGDVHGLVVRLLEALACVAPADLLAVQEDDNGVGGELHHDSVLAPHLEQLRRVAAVVPLGLGADAHMKPRLAWVDEQRRQPLFVCVAHVQETGPRVPQPVQRHVEREPPAGAQCDLAHDGSLGENWLGRCGRGRGAVGDVGELQLLHGGVRRLVPRVGKVERLGAVALERRRQLHVAHRHAVRPGLEAPQEELGGDVVRAACL